MRWVLLLQSFNMEVKYRPGKSHTNADSMSRMPGTEDMEVEGESPGGESPADEYESLAASALLALSAMASPAGSSDLNSGQLVQVFSTGSTDLVSQIAQYLSTLIVPEGLSSSQVARLKRKAREFCIFEGHLFKRGSKDTELRRVLLSLQDKHEVMVALHDDDAGGHRGRDATYRKVSCSYFWPGMYADISKYVESCDLCQRRSKLKQFEPLKPLPIQGMFGRVHLDVVGPMHRSYNKRYIVVARDSFSGWVEARALAEANANTVSNFLLEDIVLRHGVPGQLTVDRG